MTDAERVLREKCAWMVTGTFPEVLKKCVFNHAPVPHGTRVIIAILPVEDLDA